MQVQDWLSLYPDPVMKVYAWPWLYYNVGQLLFLPITLAMGLTVLWHLWTIRNEEYGQ
jgi:hypothetical protein